MEYIKKTNQIIYKDGDRVLAGISFPKDEYGVYDINHTYVEPELRGQGIGKKLVELAVEEIKKDTGKWVASCPYANKILNKNSSSGNNKINLDNLNVFNENIDLNKYITFREEIKKEMENPDWLGDFSKEDLEYLLANKSRIWLWYDKDTPVCSMMFIPATHKDIEKFGLDLDYLKVVDYGPMMVNKNYRGNNLQLQMLKKLDEYSKKENYHFAISTVHPDNFFSIKNLEKDKFKKVGNKEFKRGVRNIYLKILDE